MRRFLLFAATALLAFHTSAAANPYVIQLNDEFDPDPVMKFHGVGIKPGKVWKHALRGFAADLNAQQLLRLTLDTRVKTIEPDLTASTLAPGTTYYIDYAGGNDANNGLAKGTAWQRHPYMKGFAGSYTHVAGDRFIFKGGVTWPTTSFQMRILAGGSDGASADYYGVDPTWFTGGAWSRPIFDLQNTIVTNYAGLTDYERSAAILLEGYGGAGIGPVRFITFDSLEVKNFRGPKGAAGFKSACFTLRGQCNNITLQNCLVRDWDMATITSAGDDPTNIGGVVQADGQVDISGCVIDSCEFTTAGAAQRVGQAIHGWFTLNNTAIHDVCNAFLGNGVLTYNHVYNIVDATDTTAHENAIYTQSPSVVHHNRVHNSVTGGIYASPGLTYSGASYNLSTGAGLDLIYDNLVYSIGSMSPIEIDEEGAFPSRVGSRVFNNTVEHGSSTGIRVNTKATLGYFEARNNHIITSGAQFSYNTNYIAAPPVFSNNLGQSPATAAAQGYTLAGLYAPANALGSTVGAGFTLSSYFTIDYVNRTRVAPWDIGAYQWAAAAPSTQVIPTGVRRIGTLSNAFAHISGVDTGRVNVAVAVIDTGIDLTHPDLNVVGGTNFVDGVTTPNDDNGHGTHVAGTIGALDNTFGVVGVAPGAKLYAVKVLDSTGNGSLSSIISGINWVAQNANVIAVANMSLGGRGYSDALRSAIANANARGVVVVVAAGNSGFDVYGGDFVLGTIDDFYPSALPESAAISALADSDGLPGGLGPDTAYGKDDTLAGFSNWSSTVVDFNPVISPGAAIDVAAPGVNIYSTYKNGAYATLSGTSMAAPHVAGAVALYIAQYGRATNTAGVSAIRQAIINAADPQISWGINPPNPYGYDTKPEGLLHVANFAPLTASYPSVSISFPVANVSTLTTTPIPFAGSAVDVADGDISASLYWTSSLDGHIGTGASFSSTLSAGAHIILAAVTNSAGLVGRAGVTPILISAPVTRTSPTITITTPTNTASYASTAAIAFSGSALDSVDGSLTSRLSWSSSIDGVIGSGGAFTRTLSAGAHVISASAANSAGLSGSAKVNVTVTGTPPPPPPTNYPPVLYITYPTASLAIVSGTTLVTQGSASDVEDGDLSSAIRWNDSAAGALGAGASVSYAPALGPHTLTASVRDTSNAVATASVAFTVFSPPTNHAPVVTISQPASGTSVASGASVVFGASALDTEEGSLTNLVWSDSVGGAFGAGPLWTNTMTVAATHVITASCTDTNGATGSASINVVVTAAPPPHTPPVLTLTGPASGSSLLYGASVVYSATATDYLGTNITSSILWNDSLEGAKGNGASVSWTPISGAHVLSATVTDSGGITSSTNRTFTVSTPSYALSVAVATDSASYIKKQKARVTATVTSGGTNIAGASVLFTLTAAGGKTTNYGPVTTSSAGTASWSYPVNPNAGGNGRGVYTVKANATAPAFLGGSGSATFTVR